MSWELPWAGVFGYLQASDPTGPGPTRAELYNMLPLAIFMLFAGAIIVATVVLSIRYARRTRPLLEERQGDSICTFARSLDYRRLDTTVIRAVYEGLQKELEFASPAFPIRPGDDVLQIYQLDPEDYEELVIGIAERVGRSLDRCERNPYYGQSSTVSGLIEFLCAQPVAQGK